MSSGFQIFDEFGVLRFSSENLAYLLLDVIDVTESVNGSKTYPLLPAGMDLFANWTPNRILEYTVGATFAFNRPTTESSLSITVSGNIVSWSWVNGTRSAIDGGATIRVFAV